VRFSTAELAPRDRIPFFREVCGPKLARVDIEPLGEGPFHAEAVLRTLPGLGIASTANSPMRVERTRKLLADGNDDLLFAIPGLGPDIVSHGGRELTLAAGEAVLVSNADPYVSNGPNGARLFVLRLRRAKLAPAIPGVEDAFVRPVPRDNEALRLLVGYLKILDQQSDLESPELHRLTVAHVYDLVSLAIGASRDAAAVAEGRGLRAARLRAVKADIAEHLGNGDLSVAEVAARQRLSPRYVQMLFEGEGTTFSQHVLNRRLVCAHRLLADPRSAGLTITAIAFEAGFSDLSYFNRTFRRLYGASPSEVRAAGRG
jgi:AraC-like DNA-binding protein